MSHLDEKAIFLAARCIVSPDARRSYLAEACGDDRNLRLRMDALLRVYDDDPSFLAIPAPPLPDEFDSPNAAQSGAVIGPYRLVERLGEGGMGDVFRAEQMEPVRRQVALKFIKQGMDTRLVVARFQAERQALAVMDHPNIAKVFDAGTTSNGRPYFVMELVQGVPITRYCDERRITPKERLKLFIPVCHAVQHAHQKGIIHRDLKPSNVLVGLCDDQPIPKVIDFGIAKALEQKLTEETLRTESGSVMGTLQYMSPEQAEPMTVDIDTRCDVYSLGVLLYELLTGTTPLQRETLSDESWLETLRAIREVEPPKPSKRLDSTEELQTIAANRGVEPKKLRSELHGDLDWIVMKCLEKDRARRYPTANGLARDIQNFLNEEPVEACPPSAAYRLKKTARKHKKALAAAGAFAALLLTATAVSVGLASWALRERNRADDQKVAAEANFRKAMEAVDQMLTRVGETQLSHVPQMELVRRDLLQDALRFYQEFLRDRGDDPQVRLEAATAFERVGSIQSLLGQPIESETAYQQASSLLEALLAQSPNDPSYREKLAVVRNSQGTLFTASQKWPLAESAFQQALEIQEKLELEDPSNRNYQQRQVASLSNMVMLYRQMGGRHDQAEAAFRRCKTLLDRLLAADPNNVINRVYQSGSYHNIALVYGAQGRTADAIAATQRALELNRLLVRDDPGTVEHRKRLAQSQNNLGLFYARSQQPEKAEAAYRESLALNEAIHRDYPNVVGFRVDVGGSYGNMAMHVRTTGSPEESLEWSAKAIAILEPVIEQNPRHVVARSFLFDTLLGRGHAFVRLDRRDEAHQAWRRAVDVSAGQAHINMRLYRPPSLARLGEHAQAAAEIESLLADGHAQGSNLYTFAYVLSICSAAVASDAALTAPERERLADKYGARAVELLRKAHEAGYFRSPERLKHLKGNADLDAIRTRADFQKFVDDVSKVEKPDS